MYRNLTVITLFALTTMMIGCGAGFQAGEPWNPNEGRLFDDGVDTLDDLSKLSGKFAYQAEEELNARTNLADFVGIVSMDSLQTNINLSGDEVKRMEVSVNEALYGQNDSKTIVFTSSKDSLGYALIIRHERHLTGEFLLFIRWFMNEDHTIGNHFHLSPSSKQIRKKVDYFIDARKKEESIQSAK